MKNITDESFKKYGRILNLDTTEFVETMLKKIVFQKALLMLLLILTLKNFLYLNNYRLKFTAMFLLNLVIAMVATIN